MHDNEYCTTLYYACAGDSQPVLNIRLNTIYSYTFRIQRQTRGHTEMVKVSIPVFPPWCVVPPVETHCSFLGITIPCVPAIDITDVFGIGVQMGHWITFILLVGIGIVNLWYVRFPFRYEDSMKITTGLYSIITALFSFFRLAYHVSRLLLVGAALHNLAEWAILMQISAANTTSTKVKDGLRRATFFIIIIVFLVVMMPTLKLAVLVEQSFGIMLDIALPMAYWYMFFTASSERVRSFYRYPAVAHTIHLLFTILPLVFANFHVGQLSWYSSFYLETAIYISAPVTHILYMVSMKGVWGVGMKQIV